MMLTILENNINSFVFRKNINENNGSSVEIIKVNGQLLRTESNALLLHLREAVSCNPAKVIVDLNDVYTINVAGSQAIRECRKICHGNGVEFEIASHSDGLLNIVNSPDVSLVMDPTIPIIDFLYSEAINDDCKNEPWKIYEFIALADASAVPILREKILEAIHMTGANDEILIDIQIASGEALTNAYKHGSPNKGVNKIKLRFMVCNSAIAVEIEDEGKPFNPWTNYRPNPLELRDNGMGIFLMKESMDKVEFFSGTSGNRVRMLKWLQKQDTKQYANAV